MTPGRLLFAELYALASVKSRKVKNTGCVGLSTDHGVDCGFGSGAFTPHSASLE